MAFKFALIAALCVVQAFAFKPLGKFPGKKPCNPAVEIAEEIPFEFEETMQEMDGIRETVSMAAMDAYVQGSDPEVIIACFREQRKNYAQLGQKIAGMVREASSEMAKELGEKYEKYAKKAEVPLRTIGKTMKLLPQKMWFFIQFGEFAKAFEVMKESRRTVEENARILAQIMKEMAGEVPEAAQKAEKMAREIREASRKGCREIGEAFHKCVEEGGPKHPVEDDEDDVEVEEAPEQ